MALVMITCPATKRQVSTGIETDPASIALLPPINARLNCPACGRVHTWSVLDAELVCEYFETEPENPVVELQLRRLLEKTSPDHGEARDHGRHRRAS